MSAVSCSVSRPYVAGDRHDGLFGHLLGGLHQGVVERAVLALPSRSERSASRELRAGPEDRKLLVDQTKIRIGLSELDHGRRDPAAVRAVVVEELDDRDVTRGIAADRRRRVVQDLLAALGDRPLEIFRLGRALSLLQDCSASMMTSGFFKRYWRTRCSKSSSSAAWLDIGGAA